MTNPLAVVFEVLPAKEGSEVGAIVNAFQQQLADPTSQLRQGVVTKFLDDTATPDVTYGTCSRRWLGFFAGFGQRASTCCLCSCAGTDQA